MDRFISADEYKRRVMIIDDEEINRLMLGNILETEYEVVFAKDGQEAWDLLHGEEKDISLLLLDLLMPVMNGFELISKLNEDDELKSIPVIVMTSEKEAEVKSIKLGASDFITKPYDMPEVILARCERIIKLSEETTLIHSTEKDAVTGLFTRDYFFEYIRQIEARHNSSVDALVFNIDHFHLVNEMYGRKTGDSVLVRVANTLEEVLKEKEIISCRTEADTFYVLCEHIDDYTPLIAKIQELLGNASGSSKIRLRAGIYQEAAKDMEVELRFDRAKIACDRIRGDYSRNAAYYNNELYQKSIYYERLIRDVDDAIANEDFKVFFQPKYDITSDTPKLRSAEALIRWQHPELGMISPGDFIPLFESNGLIQKVDNYVWKTAASQIRKWKEKYNYSVAVSVNVSRIDIFDPTLQDKLRTILEENGLDASELMLEITESAYADSANTLTEVAESLLLQQAHRGTSRYR